MKKLITAAALAATFGASFLPVAYADHDNGKNIRKDFKQDRQQLRKDIKEDKQDFRDKIKDERKDFKASEAAKIKSLKNKFGHLNGATVSGVSSSSFTVTKDGKTYTINTSDKTQFRRHFWGKSSLSELSTGDKVNVWGKWTDDAQTTLDARLVRNLSVMKRRGVFMGQIKSLGSGSFVLQSINRGDQTVSYGSSTKLVNRKEATIAASDLKVGDKVKVKGMWDKANNTITEVSQVKDFSLPAKTMVTPTPNVTVTVTPTLTVTPTVTPTPTP
jgi:sRNA-binding protein